jgi:hypothetical protein
LRSPKEIHIVLQRQFKDFVKQLFVTHPVSSSFDTFDGVIPRFLNRGKKASLMINPSHTPRL